MFGEKYYFNRETLRFEKLEKTLQRKFRDGLIYFGLLVVLAIGIRIFYDQHFASPKIKSFSERNELLKRNYSVLNQKIKKAEFFLTEIQKRDDMLYRSVLELDPIPGSVREAGFGGSENYENMLSSRNTPLVTNTAKKLEKLSTKARIQSLSLNNIFERAKEQQQILARKPSIQPISPSDKYWLTSTFGYRYDPFTKRRKFHQGIDIAGEVGLKIYATGDGVITEAHYSLHGYGKELVIDHGFGYRTRYAHLHKYYVKKGDKVKRGQLIAELGSTGRSTGPHLHYEVLLNNSPLNPMYYYFEDLSPEEYGKIIALKNN